MPFPTCPDTTHSNRCVGVSNSEPLNRYLPARGQITERDETARGMKRQGYSGMLPCFFGGKVSRLFRSNRSPRTIWPRVDDGAITEST